MKTAKISEIFLSYQGEGPYASSRQLFVRFYGCNRKCSYCDTRPESYKTFTKDNLMSSVMDFGGDYNELVLTGGEPLLFADFLADFLKLFRSYRKNRVYLETNGTLPDELKKVIGSVDVVSMDIKLPSSTGECDEPWDLHEEFGRVVGDKELIVKAVVTGSTEMDDIKHLADLMLKMCNVPHLILQPVTPENEGVEKVDSEMLTYFKRYLQQKTGKDIIVLGQMHKCLGIK